MNFSYLKVLDGVTCLKTIYYLSYPLRWWRCWDQSLYSCCGEVNCLEDCSQKLNPKLNRHFSIKSQPTNTSQINYGRWAAHIMSFYFSNQNQTRKLNLFEKRNCLKHFNPTFQSQCQMIWVKALFGEPFAWDKVFLFVRNNRLPTSDLKVSISTIVL